MRITLHVSGLMADGDTQPRDLNIRGVVRRCTMIDHQPTYLVGIQFVDQAGHDERALIADAAQEDAGQPVSVGGAGVPAS